MRFILADDQGCLSERKEDEATLWGEEGIFRFLFEKSPDPSLLLEENTCVCCNEAAVRNMHGSAKEQLIGSRPFDLAPESQPDGRLSSEKAEELIEAVLQEGMIRFKWMGYALDGEEFWVDVSLASLPIPGKQIMHMVWRDIAGRKQAVEEPAALQERVSDIIDFLPDATFVINCEGRVTAWNNACVEMTGITKEEILGKGSYEYAIPFYGERRPMLIDHVAADLPDFGSEYCGARPRGNGLYAQAYVPRLYNGKGAFLAGNVSTLCDGQGKAIGFIECLRDITELKHLESQLLQSQKIEAMGNLAGGIAHDFNNILTAVIGYGNLLQMKMGPDEPLRKYVDQILASSEKAAGLTQKLMAFSRKQAIELKPRRVNGMVAGIEKLLQSLLSEDIELRVILRKEAATIMADITQIEQVLLNLATNARDAMPKGGILTIETSLAELDNEFVGNHGYGRPGSYAKISLTDTGCGMDEKTREKIFEPFFTTKDTGKGTGLGLATVYGAVKQHKGYIEVRSEPAKGTTFSIYFPLIAAEAEEAKPVRDPAIGGTETILIAEDNPSVRKLTKEILTGAGYTTLDAPNGADAVRSFIEYKDLVSLVILDVVMPRKNGKEVYEEIAKAKPDVKVIFTSGYTDDVIFDKGIHGGTFDFMSKPLDRNELLLKVREVLDKRH